MEMTIEDSPPPSSRPLPWNSATNKKMTVSPVSAYQSRSKKSTTSSSYAAQKKVSKKPIQVIELNDDEPSIQIISRPAQQLFGASTFGQDTTTPTSMDLDEVLNDKVMFVGGPIKFSPVLTTADIEPVYHRPELSQVSEAELGLQWMMPSIPISTTREDDDATVSVEIPEITSTNPSKLTTSSASPSSVDDDDEDDCEIMYYKMVSKSVASIPSRRKCLIEIDCVNKSLSNEKMTQVSTQKHLQSLEAELAIIKKQIAEEKLSLAQSENAIQKLTFKKHLLKLRASPVIFDLDD